MGFVAQVSPSELQHFLNRRQISDFGVFVSDDEGRECGQVLQFVNGTIYEVVGA